ncbi:hypothetical protein SLS62_004051 [Diatrype stigma]|uniref:Heterokaryon incompatibility domain-containing protein n=1 Tax=Diatrype stigma TaxID=117547 RepID=A0AAN9V5L5_9PEZI
MGGKTGKTLLGGSSLLFGVSAIRMWRHGHFREYLARWWPLGRWKLFDPEMLSPDNRDISRRLCNFLDHAQSPVDGDQLNTSSVQYDALSYVWGDATETVSITVNTQSFEIRKNLDTALRYLRLEKGRRVLWVDAICINQHDNTEKSCLVAGMSDIYEQAKYVIAFLGPGLKHSRLFDFCNEFTNDDVVDMFQGDELQARLERHGIERILAELIHLLNQPWWSRAWIIQELAYAGTDPMIMYGDEYTHVRNFYRLFEHFHEQQQTFLPETSESDGLNEYWGSLKRRQSNLLWRARFHPAMHSVAELLQATRGQQATDPRDKVFAFQSLMMEPARSAFTPDYTKTTSVVYTRMAAYLLCIEKWDKMFLTFPLASSPELPSWVPDFSSAQDELHDLLWADTPRLQIGNFQAVVKAAVLGVRGACCGKVNSKAALVDDEDANVSYHFASDIPQFLLETVEATLTVFGQGPVIEPDETEKVYQAMMARPGMSFFTMDDLEMLFDRMSQGYPCQATRLMSRKSSHTDPEELMAALSSGINQVRSKVAPKWFDRSEREGPWMNKGYQTAHPYEMEKYIQQFQEDYKHSKRKAEKESRDRARRRRNLGPGEKRVLASSMLTNVVFTTETGLVGIGPLDTQQGDCVVVLYGIDIAFVARPRNDGGPMMLVGKVWLHQDAITRIREGIEKRDFEESTLYFR